MRTPPTGLSIRAVVIGVSYSDSYCTKVRGTIVIDNDAGRALRRKPAAVRASDVLYCMGDFCAGDAVYIAFRTEDGSQYVVATGIAGCNEGALRQAADLVHAAHVASAERDNVEIVVREQDVRLLWPPPPPEPE
jgi:glutamate 5-kinase